MLKVPAKYKRCGIKVKCLRCKWQVTTKCGLTGRNISSCEQKDKHRFNLVVCVPNSPGKRRTKILDTTNFEEALAELHKFKSEQKSLGYHKLKVKKESPKTTITHFITSYLDAVSGENTPAILIRKRSKDHIGDSLRAFERFRDALTNAGYNFNGLEPKDITDEHVNVFHEYLLNDLHLGTRSYNKHIGIMKTLWNWMIRVKDMQIPNPFNHIELHNAPHDVSLITKAEFEKLLSVITRENSFDQKTKRYMYRDWLVPAYRLALETGLRREELLTLSWADIVPIDGNKLVCKINNLKVNRIITGRSEGGRIKYVPVTKGLLALLNELGYATKKDSAEYIIERPANQELSQAMDLLSRCFAHYIKYATERPLEFGVLRKTFITHLTMAAGPNAKLFTGSSSDLVLKNHYLSTAYMAANLDDFTVL